MDQLDLSYAGLLPLIEPYRGAARTESRSFLAWYLENIYRLEPTLAQDAICDGEDDKGIDGVYVDKLNSRIDVFQARLVQNQNKAVGDTQIKQFKGTLAQFASAEAVRNLGATTRNLDLKHVLEDNEVVDLVGQGWEVRGVFVTNALIHESAVDYLANCGSNIGISDRNAIAAAYVPSGHAAIVSQEVSFDVFGYDVASYQVGEANVIVAPLKARELVEMKGIESGGLFDYNVRQFLGNTSVNKDIVKSVRNKGEHHNFLLYHNGVTVVAEHVKAAEGRVTIDNYVVVNGCQSLSVFWDQRSQLSEDLRVLARIIQIDRMSPLMGLITHHSNNQNGIKPRDFQSNNPIQLRLRNEFEARFGGAVFYQVSRGEESSTSAETIDNELAARALLAFDLREPWTSHQTYKLFDDLHSRIFARPEVNADRILAVCDIYGVVDEQVRAGEVSNQLLAKYTLTKFFLIYLIREAMEADELGREFAKDPSRFLAEENGRERLKECVRGVLGDLIVDLNAEVQEREEARNPFDFKRDLKSADAVRKLGREIQALYSKAARRGRVDTFSTLWQASAG